MDNHMEQTITLEEMLRYKELLETDVLTGLKNRYAYTEDLKKLDEEEGLPNNLVVFSVDINELKKTNDTLGHLAGDELLQGASYCIRNVLGTYGKCFRIGGDEFVAFIYIDSGLAYELKVRLMDAARSWHGALVPELSLSIGYAAASQYPEVVLSEKLINIADEKMYEAKAQYYVQSGRNRRKNETKNDELMERTRSEYVDIISAFASDVTGLYVIDRVKREVTAYRISASNHQIRTGVPLKLGFETAMEKFINKNVHPDDRETMRQSIHQEFIERELVGKKSFLVHFRTLINGNIGYNYMKCIRNREEESYDKLIVSFCPEDALSSRKREREKVQLMSTGNRKKILIVMEHKEYSGFSQIVKDTYDCFTMTDGRAAIEFLQKNYAEISIVLYQNHLPGLFASDFLKLIREDVFISMVPVIVVMGKASEKDEEEVAACSQLGALDFIQKPYNKAIILHRVENILRIRTLYASLDEIEIDELTGLYTKQAFLYHAETLINESPDEEFTIVIVDIFNFKRFNRVYGMNKGDELLKILAKTIRGIVTNGISARYGADQMISIVKTPVHDISYYMKVIQDGVNQSGIDNIILKYGVYNKVDHNLEVTTMCDRALQALQSIKKNFDTMYARFDGPVSQQQIRAQMYESRFKRAIDDKEFVIWYQPKYNIYTEQIVGAEALVRWKMKDGSTIPPGEFLPVFEKDGLISQLDEYVFRMVCEQQKKWKDIGKPLFPISVNLSRNSMHHAGIIKRYKAIVEEMELTPDLIPIEITESAAKGTMEIKPLADAFYEAGFSLHMDDFGSENSSIVGLNVLHFDTVKLDRSLIQYIGTQEGNLVLMYTVSLGKELGLQLVAEGAETWEQIEYLKDIGCECVQGYYFCKPLPTDEFEKKVEATFQKAERSNQKYDQKYKLTSADSIVKRAMDRMIQRMPGGFFTYRRDNGHILSSNSYLWYIYGCNSEEEFMEYVGGTFQGMVHPDDYEVVAEYIEKQIRDNEQEMDYVEYRVTRKDGRVISVVDYGHLDHQPDGDIFYVFLSM